MSPKAKAGELVEGVGLREAPRAALRHGDWQTVLASEEVDAVITDPPYSARTHAAATTRNDGTEADGLTPDYAPWTRDDVFHFVRSWHERTRGWMACMTDDTLAPAYREAYRDVGRFDFHPVPCVIRGMSCRMQGDGPSSEAIYVMVSRPRRVEFVGGWTTPGAYVGNSVRLGRAGGSAGGRGRGKPPWLEHALVRDYSRVGWRVCDPLAGLGGVLVAALALGRSAVGAEIDAETFRAAKKRLSRPLQVDLFSGSATEPQEQEGI